MKNLIRIFISILIGFTIANCLSTKPKTLTFWSGVGLAAIGYGKYESVRSELNNAKSSYKNASNPFIMLNLANNYGNIYSPGNTLLYSALRKTYKDSANNLNVAGYGIIPGVITAIGAIIWDNNTSSSSGMRPDESDNKKLTASFNYLPAASATPSSVPGYAYTEQRMNFELNYRW